MLDSSITMPNDIPHDEEDADLSYRKNAFKSQPQKEHAPTISSGPDMADRIIDISEKTRDGVNHAIDFAFHLYFQLLRWNMAKGTEGTRDRVSRLTREAKELEKEQIILAIMDQIKKVAKGDGIPELSEGQLRELAEDALPQIEAMQREDEAKERVRIDEKRENEILRKEKHSERMQRKLVVKGQRYPVVMPDTSMTTPQSKSDDRKRKRPPREGKGFDKSHKPYSGGRR